MIDAATETEGSRTVSVSA